jgi:hypothetical protein
VQVLISWDGCVLGVEQVWNSLRLIQVLVILIYVVGALTPGPVAFIQQGASTASSAKRWWKFWRI